MATLFGMLGLQDTDRAYINTIGQDVIYGAAQQLLAQYNADLNAAMAVLVQGKTEGYKERYKLPMTGRLQRRALPTQTLAVKGTGSWDVAYPLEDFGDQVAGDDVSIAYTTVQELQEHFDGIMIRNTNTVRFELLKAIFNNTARTFVDPLYGSLTVQPLANNDAVVYPPILGSEVEAQEQHYIETGYLVAAINDTNNPLITGRDELEEHFGAQQGGGNILAFANTDVIRKLQALSDFDPINDNHTIPGQDTDQLSGLPTSLPGRIVGRCDGCWIVEWRYVPANYMFFVDPDARRPLKMRIDEAATGLGSGLQLVAHGTGKDGLYPIESWHWRNRFGVGVGNRLNGVVLEFGNGGSYTIPTIFA